MMIYRHHGYLEIKRYCGFLEPVPAGDDGVAHAFLISRNRRIFKIPIENRELGYLLDKRIVIAVGSWHCLSGRCYVRTTEKKFFVRTIGKIGDTDAETEVLVMENDIDVRPFSSQVLSCLPPLPWSVSFEDLANPIRQDLRHLCVFSVDSPGCKIVDDALHCRALPNGNFEVGVHIADVTNFVRPGTALDDKAAQRGNLIKLVDRGIDMLPKPLTEYICSLRADVERLAFSVIWEMTPEAEIISTKYTKSVIKSCAALSYVEAQARMDDDQLTDPVTTNLRNLNALAKIMRQRRIDRGALAIALTPVDFGTETHDPLNIEMHQTREASQMVEEFMVAANVSVAEKIQKDFPSCSLLRRQPAPKKEMLESLLQTAATFGLTLDVSSSKALVKSLDCAENADPCVHELIRTQVTRSMAPATYICSGDLSPAEYNHYGLAAPLYTHFTSPIRRYADIVVHRLLAASLGINMLSDMFQDPSQLTSIADNLNYRHRKAKMARRASVELHTLIYFRNKPTDTEAKIVKIQSDGFTVYVPKYGIEGPVSLNKKGGEWLVDEQQQSVKRSDNSKSYGMLQTVQIHIGVVEPVPHRPRLELTLIET